MLEEAQEESQAKTGECKEKRVPTQPRKKKGEDVSAHESSTFPSLVLLSVGAFFVLLSFVPSSTYAFEGRPHR